MLGEDVALAIAPLKSAIHFPRQVELLLEPLRHGLDEGFETDRRVAQIGLEQPIELEQGLVVETDIVQIFRRQSGLLQAVLNRILREGMVMLLTRETLFLRRRHDPPIDHQSRCGVVVEGRYPENGGAHFVT